MNNYEEIIKQFQIKGTISSIKPLGNGLINDTLLVETSEVDCPDYVLQRINSSIFTDVELLQRNIFLTTKHIKEKLLSNGEKDIDRKVLTFIKTKDGKSYYKEGYSYWRVSLYIPDSVTFEQIDPDSSYQAGKAFGQFQAMLSDLEEPLGETIPNFHNMEYRLEQFKTALSCNIDGRVEEMHELIVDLLNRADQMCIAEKMYRNGLLPKRICHCDTKVNNMLFDAHDSSFLCVIDLDTVMPSFIFSDYGDFLRTAANTAPEDEPDLSKIHFNTDIFEAFTRGYLESTIDFLSEEEIELLPFAVKLFPYMQCVRFLTDYISGDKYYKTKYLEHNKIRALAQFELFKQVEEKQEWISASIAQIIANIKQ